MTDKEIAQEIVRIREEERLSWRLIGERFGYSPDKTRKAWSKETGKPHKEAPEVAGIKSRERVEEGIPVTPIFPDDVSAERVFRELFTANEISIHYPKYGMGVITYKIKQLREVRVSEHSGLYIQFIDDQGKYRTPAVNRIVRFR